MDVVHEVGKESAAVEAPQYTPSVYIEVSKEQLDMLEIGKTVEIKLLGRIKALSADERDGANDRYNIDLELNSVKIEDQDNDMNKLLDDDE